MRISIPTIIATVVTIACGSCTARIPKTAIPFKYNRHLYFDVTVCDSVPARFIFDTGATGLYVDSLWLARSGIAAVRREPVILRGTGKNMVMSELFRDKLVFDVDPVRLRSRKTFVIRLREVLGRQADGVFGQAYLSGKCVELYYGQGYMRRVRADTLAAAGFVRHAVEKRRDRLYVRARVELAGGHRFGGVPVEVSANKSGTMAYGEIMGLIGNELLSRFDVVIDFATPVLWLRPTAGIDAPWPFVTPGFTAVDRTDICEGWPVSLLFERPYAPEGLRQGDVIVTWDGVPVTKLDLDSVLVAPGPHRMEALRGGVKTEYEFETKEIL